MQDNLLLTVKPILSLLVRQCMEGSLSDLSYSRGVQTIPEGKLILSVVRRSSGNTRAPKGKSQIENLRYRHDPGF